MRLPRLGLPRLGLTSLSLGLLAGLAIAAAAPAQADSFWDHNGSLMRLQADGERRFMRYERPRDVLVRAGVRRGTLLFDGVRDGNRYRGTARVFSRHCEAPLEYPVSGDVAPDSSRITLTGTREVYGAGCVPTGAVATDRLIFTYSHSD